MENNVSKLNKKLIEVTKENEELREILKEKDEKMKNIDQFLKHFQGEISCLNINPDRKASSKTNKTQTTNYSKKSEDEINDNNEDNEVNEEYLKKETKVKFIKKDNDNHNESYKKQDNVKHVIVNQDNPKHDNIKHYVKQEISNPKLVITRNIQSPSYDHQDITESFSSVKTIIKVGNSHGNNNVIPSKEEIEERLNSIMIGEKDKTSKVSTFNKDQLGIYYNLIINIRFFR